MAAKSWCILVAWCLGGNKKRKATKSLRQKGSQRTTKINLSENNYNQHTYNILVTTKLK